ncbi:PAS domain-containing sensor histidine kinase [Clostridium sp.]|uniref:PAS domain-containing sensor histidine kinase n=1 Tax=Clostridium sp. TaxID=1506 RepID=UPI002FC7F921
MLNLKLKEIRTIKLLYVIVLGVVINFFISSLLIYSIVVNEVLSSNRIILLTFMLMVSSLGQIFAILNVIDNIKNLKEYKDIFKQVVEALPNAVFIHRKLKFIYANIEGAKFFNLNNPEKLIGRPVSDFIKLNVDYIGDDRLNGALSETVFRPLVENVITKANGEVVEVETFSTPLFINDKVNVLNILKDLTKQKELEQLQKKVEEEEMKLKEAVEIDRLRNEFFANLSHELRTPLTIIFGTMQLIEKEMSQCSQKDDILNKRLKTLKQNCYRLLRLINNLIDMTKIDAGYFSIALQNHNIIPIIEDITLSVVEFAKNKGIHIEFDTEIEEEITACDPDKIERIMLNLLSNAIKFTRPGGIIKISVLEENSYLKVVVEDDGIGMPEDKLTSIFDRFVQVDKSFTRNHEGSGLGLSIVKSFVNMHGGNIKVESKAGEGTAFTIELPITLVEEDAGIMDFLAIGESHVERVKIEFSDIYS